MAAAASVDQFQQQFMEGKNTDAMISVRVGRQQQSPAAKRRRTSAARNACTEINAHKMVPCARSAYFDRALSGEWAEAAERRIELTLNVEQELEDVKLLIKLSHSDSYTHDDGELLPLDTWLRLAVRADALEFVEALDQIVASLPLELDFKGALKCCGGGELPPVVEAHAGMAAARQQMVAVLAKGTEERQGNADEDSKQQLHAGVEALAKALGPVAGMFEAGSVPGGMPSLSDDMKQLSPGVFKQLLASNALQLQLENEAYVLFVA